MGLVLGSGLGGLAERIRTVRSVPYARIPGFRATGVSGHSGRLVLGHFAGKRVAALCGRIHYYEGHSMERVIFPVRALAKLGVSSLILTAAVGSLRPDLRPGSLVAVRDHINFMGRNPLRGPRPFGPDRGFVDLGECYSKRILGILSRSARSLGMTLRSGVYAASSGPSYETPAEAAAFRLLGGDVAGMSVVPEAVAARAAGLEVAAVCLVTNFAGGAGGRRLRHEDVTRMADLHGGKLVSLLEKTVRGL